MPGKMVECPSCTKIMRSDNLKRHKNSCKVARQGCGILFTPASNGIVHKRSNVQPKKERADSVRSSSSVSSEESTIDHIVADAELDESDMDTDEDNISESGEENADEENDYENFWTF